MQHLPHRIIVGFHATGAGHGKGAGKAKIAFKVFAHAAGIGFVGDNGERRRRIKILRHRPPQIPDGFDGGMLFPLDERLGVQPQQLAQLAQEFRR